MSYMTPLHRDLWESPLSMSFRLCFAVFDAVIIIFAFNTSKPYLNLSFQINRLTGSNYNGSHLSDLV